MYPFIEISMACSSCDEQEAFWIKMFDAEVIFRGKMMGQPFTRLMVWGISLIFREMPDFKAPPGPGQEFLYRDHLGIRCQDLDAAVAELEARGAHFTLTPAKVRELQKTKGPGDMGNFLQTTYIKAPLTQERISAGEFRHDVAIMVGPDNIWIELNAIHEPSDTQWYPFPELDPGPKV